MLLSPLRKGLGSPPGIKNKFKQAVRKVAALNNLSTTLVSPALAPPAGIGLGHDSNRQLVPKSRHMINSSTFIANILNNSQIGMKNSDKVFENK